MQNANIFLKSRGENGLRSGRLACLLACPLVQVIGLSRVQDLTEYLRWSSGGVFRPFCPLCCSSLGALLANMALFRVLGAFLARFVAFVWVGIACVPCVACGAFVCVRG